jgi:steroid 5-alpha reductase family enzyme
VTALQTALLVLVVGMGVSCAMAAAWGIQRRTGQSGWIDTIWSLSAGLAGFVFALAPVQGSDHFTARQVAIATLVLLWGLRLGASIAQRTGGGGDDPRYAQLKTEWGDEFPRRLFWFLQVQAVAAFILAISVFVAAQNPAPGLRVWDVIAIVVLATAILGEAVADAQLRRFKMDPANRGRICETGLWAYSRHPNYFFEWLGWCAYPLFAIDLDLAYPWGWLALAAPAMMYWLLVHVSGIPHLEAHMERSRGDAFRAYKDRVNAFFPGPRKA